MAWNEDRQTGQFANGDYWVVGPITVNSITPNSVPFTIDGKSRIINGAMINPVSGSYPMTGLDSRLTNYDESYNIARQGAAPLSGGNTRSIPAGSSVCLTKSHPTNIDHEFFTDFVVFTVLASAPAAGSFRPPYIGTDKTIRWNKTDLNYTILKRRPGVTGMNSAPTGDQFARPWNEISTDYNLARDYRATNNQKSYDRDIGFDVQRALLELNLDYDNATKETAYVRAVQYGIDLYAAMKYGDDEVGGTHYHPIFLSTFGQPMVALAALALNDSDIRFYADSANRVSSPYRSGGAIHHRWSLNGSIAYVNSGHVNAVVNDQLLDPLLGGRMRHTYTPNMIGMPEFLFEWLEVNTGTGSNWSNDYRDVRYIGFIGQWLAMQLIDGAKALINWPATFDYMDRAFQVYTTWNGVDSTEPYIKAFWNANRALGGTIWSATPVMGTASINEAGTQLTIEHTGVVTAGAGGNGVPIISASGGAVTATYVSGNGNVQRVYNLSRVIGASELGITYSFANPTNGVESLSGADLGSVTNYPVINYRANELGGGGGRGGPDVTAPLAGDFVINPDGVTGYLPLNEAASVGAGGATGLTLTGLSGGAVTLTPTGTSGVNVLYNLSRTVNGTETGGVNGYTQPGTGICDAAGNYMASFSGHGVFNGSLQGIVPPVVYQAARRYKIKRTLSRGFF